MANVQQQQQEAFNPTEIIYLEAIAESEGDIIFNKFLQMECPSEGGFNSIVEEIIKKNGLRKARKPRFNADSRRKLNEKNSILCNACDTEVIIYIPKKSGAFALNIKPIIDYDETVIQKPRLYYLKDGTLQKVETFSGDDAGSCQLAVFSYKGRLAAQGRGTPYTHTFWIQASGARIFPGSGDIGHPGGND